MKTKKVYLIERILCIVINVVFLPVALISALFYCILQISEFCFKQRDTFMTFISHKLFLWCDEKDVVENQTIYEHMTVKALYQYLKKMKKNLKLSEREYSKSSLLGTTGI